LGRPCWGRTITAQCRGRHRSWVLGKHAGGFQPAERSCSDAGGSCCGGGSLPPRHRSRFCEFYPAPARSGRHRYVRGMIILPGGSRLGGAQAQACRRMFARRSDAARRPGLLGKVVAGAKQYDLGTNV
jgi:hypothetical protein